MSALSEKIIEDIKSSMRTKNARRLDVLRLFKAAIMNKQIADMRPISDESVMNIIRTFIKQQNDTLADFRAGGRADLIEKAMYEIDVAKEYLPTALSEEELIALVAKVISEVGAEDIKDLGRVIGAVVSRSAGRTDGASVSRVAKQMLTNS